jgi:hypothetical protein
MNICSFLRQPEKSERCKLDRQLTQSKPFACGNRHKMHHSKQMASRFAYLNIFYLIFMKVPGTVDA